MVVATAAQFCLPQFAVGQVNPLDHVVVSTVTDNNSSTNDLARDFQPINSTPAKNLEARVDKLRPLVESRQIKSLLGFNEPDQHDQANMSVDKVIEYWLILMELGVPLVSPGCVHPDLESIHEFMEQVEQENLRVDYVAVHSYGGPSAEALVNRLKRVNAEYGRKL